MRSVCIDKDFGWARDKIIKLELVTNEGGIMVNSEINFVHRFFLFINKSFLQNFDLSHTT